MINFMEKSYVIFAHYFTTGATEELRDWLIEKKVKRVVYIAFPFLNPKDSRVSVSVYEYGVLKHTRHSLISFSKPEPLSYIKDFLYALLYGFLYSQKADLLVGGDNLLTLAANILKKLGLVRKTAYYMIDYTPERYSNKLLNSFYYMVDRLAAEGCDCVWPLSNRTIEGRFEHKRLSADKVTWKAVPYGNYASRWLPRAGHKPKRLVYMGGILLSKGAELFVPIAQALIELGIKDFNFVILGGGRDLAAVQRSIQEKGLERYFEVHGFIENFDTVIEHLLTCGVALAPYYPEDSNNFTYYADAGKLKVYLGCGLPVVTTDVPPFAKVIQDKKAGLTAEYSPQDFAHQIKAILLDYKTFETAASELGMAYEWNTIFSKALEDILN